MLEWIEVRETEVESKPSVCFNCLIQEFRTHWTSFAKRAMYVDPRFRTAESIEKYYVTPCSVVEAYRNLAGTCGSACKPSKQPESRKQRTELVLVVPENDG